MKEKVWVSEEVDGEESEANDMQRVGEMHSLLHIPIACPARVCHDEHFLFVV